MSEHRARVKVVAFGGGHGLGALLRALRTISTVAVEITAVVTVGDNGGSSGRLRTERQALPPGDLRQALVALAGDDPHSSATAELFQHRFAGEDPLGGHTVGNLVLCGLMERYGDPVTALAHAATMVNARGRVLPMSCQPVSIEAEVSGVDPDDPDRLVTVRGQHEVAVSRGRVESVRLDPAAPAACEEAVAAVHDADWLIFGPGSWYTSVIAHLLVPRLREAAVASAARRLVVLNLSTDQETAGMSVPDHLAALARYAPGLRVDVVLGDSIRVSDPTPATDAAESLGARLVLAPIAAPGPAARHDPDALATALPSVLTAPRPLSAAVVDRPRVAGVGYRRGAEPSDGAAR